MTPSPHGLGACSELGYRLVLYQCIICVVLDVVVTVLRIKLRASDLLDKCATIKLHLQPQCIISSSPNNMQILYSF
jgi:hypothetical protein